MVDNLKLWDSKRTPPKDALKNFTRGGGFKGTAIDPMWVIRAATEEWGPMGDEWGIEPHSITDQYVDGAEGQVVHIARFTLFYPGPEGPAKIPCVGQTFLMQRFGDKLKTDEEAPKKSMTDGLMKGLSWLGFGADIYMGRHDSSKYSDLDTPQQESTPGGDAKEEVVDWQSHAEVTINGQIEGLTELVGKDEGKKRYNNVLRNFHVDSWKKLERVQAKQFSVELGLMIDQIRKDKEMSNE